MSTKQSLFLGGSEASFWAQAKPVFGRGVRENAKQAFFAQPPKPFCAHVSS